MTMRTFTIGELAKKAHVNLETIRYYEREGLMAEPSRTAGGHRFYTPGAAKHLYFIKHAQKLGFTLAEIKGMLELRRDSGQLCTEAVHQVETKIEEVQKKIHHLKAIQRALKRMKDSCDGLCAVSDCPILDSLDTEVS